MSDCLKLIEKSSTFLLIAHHSPDIDSLASAIALALALKHRGKTATVATSGTINGQVTSFFDHFDLSIEEPDYSVDCIIVVDTNSPSLFDFDSVKKAKGRKILIDHHSPKKNIAKEFDATLIDESAVSTSQIIYSLLRELDEPITKKIALAVCAGIVTDSAGFIAATPEAFRILADALTETKTSFQQVLRAIQFPIEQSEKIARLKGAQRLEITREGDYIIAVSKVSSFEGGVARGLLGLGADVSFVGAAKDDEVRISARAKNDLVEKGLHLGRDILPEIADMIGGDAGGHAAAAGANGINPDTLDNALEVCVSKTREFIKTI